MRKMYKLIFIVLVTLCGSFPSFAQNLFFTDGGENARPATTKQRLVIPEKYRVAALKVEAMKNFLWTLPSEQNVMNRDLAPVMELPMPDGKMARFRVWESSIMEPGLAAKFPGMRTFAGQGIDDRSATIRFDFNPYFGFHAQILSVHGRVMIDPYARYDVNNYISYYSKDLRNDETFICDMPESPVQPNSVTAGPCRGTSLYTYRLALACTGEYAVAVAGPTPTVPAVAAAMLTSVNRVTGVYELETSMRMILVANNNLLIYLDGGTDPYTNNSGGAMLGQNQTNIDNIIGNANYDIGHVFSTGGGGVAGLGVVCRTGLKARGVTGRGVPIGDPFDIDYVAHEMGHQFGGNHTFNGSTGSCGGGNRNGSTAYEVGSGTTIQAYAGICGTDNIQPNSDPFFHTLSFDELSNYAAGLGGGCPVITGNGNILPVITSMGTNGLTIPHSTPFTLTAAATDANGDALTYCWEQWDLGPSTPWNGGNGNTTSPLFKSRIPTLSGSRTFPDLAVILAGYPANPPATMGGLKGETLPNQARTMKFRLTVRDNRAGGGGVVTGGDGCQSGFTGIFQVNVAATGPFLVNLPNGGEVIRSGSAYTVTWDPAGTNGAPVNVSDVRISLSTDGGATYPTVLAASTANDGSETFTLPCITTSTARIKIEALGNVFFDISNANFSIQPGFDFDTPAAVISPCPTPASMSVNLGTITSCGFAQVINLSASNLPAGTTVTFTPANTVLPGNNVTVTLNGTNTLATGNYTITITGIASGAVTKSRDLTFVISAPVVPVITAQPQAATICAGGSTQLCVTATGGGLTYVWETAPNCTATFTAIPASNSPCFNVNPAVTAAYRVRVTSSCATTVTSDCIVVTVVSPPVITTPPANREICSGSNTSFIITATSTQPISYQWEIRPIGSSVWTDIPGATSASLALTNLPTSASGNQYRVRLANTSCTTPVVSAPATLTVRQLPAVALSAGPLTTLLPGQTTTLNATPSSATGGTISLVWLYNNNPVVNVGNSRIVNVENTGVYKVTIQETFAGGLVCSNQSADVVIDAKVSDKLFIFPSPNDGRFTVSYYNNGGTSTQRRIVIVDGKGTQVYDRLFPITGPYTLLNIDLRYISPGKGIYYLLVGDASGKKLASGKVHVR